MEIFPYFTKKSAVLLCDVSRRLMDLDYALLISRRHLNARHVLLNQDVITDSFLEALVHVAKTYTFTSKKDLESHPILSKVTLQAFPATAEKLLVRYMYDIYLLIPKTTSRQVVNFSELLVILCLHLLLHSTENDLPPLQTTLGDRKNPFPLPPFFEKLNSHPSFICL